MENLVHFSWFFFKDFFFVKENKQFLLTFKAIYIGLEKNCKVEEEN